MTWWRRRWAPWALVGAGVLSTLPLAFVFRLASPEPGDPGINCGGIGFAETPCGWDAVGFAYALIGVPFGLAVIALVGALELGGTRTHRLRLGIAGLGAVVPPVTAVLAVVDKLT